MYLREYGTIVFDAKRGENKTNKQTKIKNGGKKLSYTKGPILQLHDEDHTHQPTLQLKPITKIKFNLIVAKQSF